jgi:CRP-like cAMP-binding protein
MHLSPAQIALTNYLKSFSLLSDHDIEAFIQLSTEVKILSKGDFYSREGDTSNNAAFVVSGILRSFYTSDDGNDFTYCITFPNNFTTAYSSFITGLPTEENIQAITPVEIFVFEKNKIEQLASGNPKWAQFLKTFAEQQYIELEKRIFQLHKYNAAQRYQTLLKNHPEYLQQIPLQYLASYLGVTQRHLSRIRKEFSF